MTLQKFMDDIDTRYANGFSDAEKMPWLNEAISEVYNDISKDKITDVTCTEDVDIYSFPTGVSAELIDNMTISASAEEADDSIFAQTYLKPVAKHEPLRRNIWSKVDEDTFLIYPKPTETGQVIRIYHQIKPIEYTDADMAEELTDYLRKDYLLAVKLHLLHAITEANDDITRSNNYATRYNAELRRLKSEKYKKQGKYNQVADMMKARSRSRRFSRRRSKGQYFPYNGS